MAIKTQKELYDLFIQELQSLRPDLTDTNEGSLIDVMGGVSSTAVSELSTVTVDEFGKTYFDTANGPEITGNVDDLERLAVDHFGSEFARPDSAKATGTVTFSRATNEAGNCIIEANTIVKTAANAAGNSQRFKTLAQVTLSGLTVNASVEAVESGTAGNVSGTTITVIETTLTDSSVTVSNAVGCSGGAAEQSDSDYREFIRNKIEALKGSSLAAIKARALSVTGVEKAEGAETSIPVIEFDISTGLPKVGASYFRVPYATLYIADSNGTASQSLINAVTTAIKQSRAGGVIISVRAAAAVLFDWAAAITLNPLGPNYATLSTDPTPIEDSMTQYVNELDIGADFDKSDAEAAILAIWGPTGTNDLTAFTTATPAGDVAVSASQKLIAQTMEIS